MVSHVYSTNWNAQDLVYYLKLLKQQQIVFVQSTTMESNKS